MRETNHVESTRNIPENLIYQRPTVSSLAFFVSKTITSSLENEDSTEADKLHEVLNMLDKYSSFGVQHASSSMTNGISKGDVVLLTGSTGGFGCNILAQLVGLEAVAKIYAVNRPSTHGITLLNRQVDALQEHGFDANSLLESKVILVESDLTLPTLGISTALFEEVTSPFMRPAFFFTYAPLIDSKLCHTHYTQWYDFWDQLFHS
jgi:hypothetical protein